MNDRMVLCRVRGQLVYISNVSRSLLPPPIRRPVPADSIQIATQRSPLGSKPVRAIPYLRKGLLCKVLRRLMASNKLTQEHLKPRLILPVERVKGFDVPFADLRPRLSIVAQYASPPCYSGWRPK